MNYFLRNINKFHYGIHQEMKGKNPLVSAINKSREMNTTCLQIFMRSPYRKSKLKFEIDEWKQDAKAARQLLRKHDMKMYIHAPYSLNTADADFIHDWMSEILLDDLKCATYSGADGVVLHVGKTNIPSKNKSYSEDIGLKNMEYNIKQILCLYLQWNWPENHNKRRAKLLIETAAGQGSELCFELFKLEKLINSCITEENKNVIGICLDTCHIFAAGHDLSTTESVKELFDKNKTLFKKIYLIHLNDSQQKLGSKKDRHAQFGKGFIGQDSMQEIVRQCKKINLPMILETKAPYDFQLKSIEKIRDE